eukprot:scaffold153350_cov30-Tisochrysis_lutea.AAC.7
MKLPMPRAQGERDGDWQGVHYSGMEHAPRRAVVNAPEGLVRGGILGSESTRVRQSDVACDAIAAI